MATDIQINKLGIKFTRLLAKWKWKGHRNKFKFLFLSKSIVVIWLLVFIIFISLSCCSINDISISWTDEKLFDFAYSDKLLKIQGFLVVKSLTIFAVAGFAFHNLETLYFSPFSTEFNSSNDAIFSFLPSYVNFMIWVLIIHDLCCSRTFSHF